MKLEFPHTVEGWVSLIGGTTGLVALAITFIYHFASGDIQAGVTAGQVESLKAAVNTNASNLEKLRNRLSTDTSATAGLQNQQQVFANEIGAISSSLASLNAKVKSLDDQVAELSKKVHAPNPIDQKCADLAEQANTGERDGWSGSDVSVDVTSSAIASMQALHCGARETGR